MSCNGHYRETDMEEVNEPKITGIFLQLDKTEMVNITDLKEKEYVDFLETMHKLRILYLTIDSPS